MSSNSIPTNSNSALIQHPQVDDAAASSAAAAIQSSAAYASSSSSASASSAASTSVSGSFSVPIVLSRLHSVCQWSWDLDVEYCAICRNLIMELCIECQSNANTNNSTAHSAALSASAASALKSSIDSINEFQCSVAWGACNHAFHFHCISKWLRTRGVCPLDNGDWEFQRYSSAQSN